MLTAIYIAVAAALVAFSVYSKSRVTKLRNDVKRLAQEKNTLSEKLKVKHMYVQSTFQRVVKKNEFLAELKQHAASSKSKQASVLEEKIEQTLNDDATWNRFVRDFQFFHTDLISRLNLNQKLTKTDIKLLGLIYFNLTNKEIALLLNQSFEGVKKARFRLRKKLNLETTDSLNEALQIE